MYSRLSTAVRSYSWLCLTVFLGMAGVASAQPAVSLRTVAVTGDPAPGAAAGVVFSFIISGVINNAGEVAFDSTLMGPDIDFTNDTGLWKASPTGVLSEVVRHGDQVPGRAAGVVVFRIGGHHLNDKGEISASIQEFGAGFNANAVWGPDGQGGFVEIAVTTETAPGGGTFTQFSTAELGNNGVTTFNGRSNPDAISAIYEIAPPGPLERTHAPGDTVSEVGDIPIILFGDPRVSREGVLGLRGVLDTDHPDIQLANAVVLLAPDDVGEFEMRWRSGETAPGLGNSDIKFDYTGLDFLVNDLGDLSLRTTVTGPGVTQDNWTVWYGPDDEGELVLFARQGDPAPGFPEGEIRQRSYIRINNVGEIAFEAELLIPGTGAPEQGVFGPTNGGSIEPRLVTTWDAPGFPAGTWVTMVKEAHINDRGDITFAGIVVHPTDGNLDVLYWTSKTGEVVPLVYEGQVLEVRPGVFKTVSLLVMMTPSESPSQAPINDQGDVAFRVNFDDGTTGLFVATVAVPAPSATLGGGVVLLVVCAIARRRRRLG